MQKETLKDVASRIRGEVIKVAVANHAGHIAPSLSCIEILTALYYKVMRFDFSDPYWPERDRLIFSKSHGCYGMYAILTEKGLIPSQKWHDFYTEASDLTGCSERRLEYGVEAGCGSLGHGLPMAVGSAFGAKLQGLDFHTFCVMGDGETQEGTTWEALQFAVKHELNNFTLIIDYNKLQAMDFMTNILDQTTEDIFRRLEGFGLTLHHCDGHDSEKLAELMEKLQRDNGQKPKVIIAHTQKGHGLKCMENIPKFHFRIPTPEEIEQGRTDV